MLLQIFMKNYENSNDESKKPIVGSALGARFSGRALWARSLRISLDQSQRAVTGAFFTFGLGPKSAPEVIRTLRIRQI